MDHTSYYVAVGYEIKFRQFVKLFGKKVKLPEKSHLEMRYDVKTGRQLKPERVIDTEKKTVFEFFGQQFDGPDHSDEVDALGIISLLRKKLDMCIDIVDNGSYDLDGNALLVVAPLYADKLVSFSKNGQIDFMRSSGNGRFTIDALVEARPKFVAFGKRLRKLGFKIEKPVVRLCASYG